MARPTQTQKTRSDFSTGSLPSVQLGVYQNFNVDNSESKATALARALGFVNQIASAGKSVTDDIKQQAATRNEQDMAAYQKVAAQNEAEGTAAAQLDNVDQERAARDWHYRNAAYKVQVEKHTLGTLNDIQSKLTSDPEWSNLSPQDLVTKIDQHLKDNLGGLETDPDAAKVMAPLVSNFVQKVHGARVQQIAQQNYQDAVDNATALAQSQADSGAWNYQSTVDNLTQLNGGNRSAAVKTAVQIVANAAIANKDSSLITKLLPDKVKLSDGQEIDGPSFVPEHQEVLTRAKQTADTLAKQQHQEDIQGVKLQIENSFVDRLNKGQYLNKGELSALVQNKTLGESEANSWYAKSESARLTQQSQVDISGALDSGTPWQLLDGTTLPNGQKFSKEMAQSATDMSIMKQPAEQRLAAAMKASRERSLPFTPYKSLIENLTYQNENQVQSALGIYNAAKANGVASLYANDAAAARLEKVQSLIDTGEDMSSVLEQMKHYDPEMAKVARNTFMPEAKKQIKTLVIDTPGIGSTDATEFANASYVTRYLENAAQVGIENNLDTDKAVAFAKQRFLDKHVLVKQGNTWSALPRTEGMPADMGDFLEWVHAKQLPNWLKDKGNDTNPSNVRLIAAPGSSDASELIAVDETGMPIKGAYFNRDALYAGYKQAVDSDRWNETVRLQELNDHRRKLTDELNKQDPLNMKPY